MSFEMKYNRDGEPIVTKQPAIPEPTSPVIETMEAEPVEVEQEPVTETMDTPEEEVTQVAAPTEPTYQKQNFRTLREEKERAEREKEEALIKLKAYEMQLQMQQQAQQQYAAQPVKEPEEIEEALPEYASDEQKELHSLKKEMRGLKKEIQQTQQRSSQNIEEAKLLAKYPDFYSVVSQESINRLRVEDPELAQVLGTSTDFYGAKAMAYKAIKKMTESKKEPTHDLESKLIQKNAAKPKSLASISPQQGDSPLSRANAFANGFNAAEAKRLWKEMEDIRRQN